jgi:autotransporter-associated beta strand protein
VAGTLNVTAASTINIAVLPVIVQYPAQFPLIQYASSSGDLTTIALGTLPVGSPPYQGYLSNNLANLSVDLVVTSGFIPTGVDIWTGAVNSNWDLTTANWSLFGSGALFLNGAIVQFDDTVASATNVNLSLGVNPASMIVSNFTKAYNFSGPGALVGSASLTKYGNNTLVFANTGTNTFGGGINLNAGTMQFGNGGTGGNLPANTQAIADNANLVLNSSGSSAVLGAISGTGSLTQNGSGVLSLSASNSFTGQATVNAGSLMVDGFLGGGGVLTNASGTTVGGIGTNLGPQNVSGIINPGDTRAIGTFTAGDGLTLCPGATASFDLSGTDTTIGNGVNDLLQVTGNLAVNDSTISVAIRGVPQTGSTYGVMTYSGSLTGSFNSTVAGTHYAAFVDTVSVPNQVNVVINGSSGANLKWDSTSSAAWDIGGSLNWLNLGTSLADYFYAGDTVLFDDSVANVVTNIAIGAGVVIYPASITNNSDANYTIGGAGSIGGTASVVKYGTGTLTLSNANSFTGGLSIYGGTLKTGSGTALGSTAAQTTIYAGASLDVNGQNLGSEQVTVSGTGVGGAGAIINNGPQQTSALKNVTLADDTTFGGTNRWDIRGGSATLQASGSPVNITKMGTNQVSLVACTCSDNNLENVDVQAGNFAIQTSSTQFGDPNGFITVHTNAVLDVWALTAGLNKNIWLQDGGEIYSESGSTTISGTVTLTNNAANTAPGTGICNNNSGTTLIVNSVVQGPGNLLKTGAGNTTLTAANTYTGNTTIGAGTLALTGSGTITTSPTITVAAGAILDASAVMPLVLPSGQTLQGSGTVIGDLTVGAGANLNPGSPNAIGLFTNSGNSTLSGSTTMKLSHVSSATNDVLSSSGTLAIGGTLNVSILAGPLAAGDTFTLFSAAGGMSGAFTATNLPALSPGLGWVTTNLANGIISVIATVNTNPTNITASVSGGVLTLSWPTDHTGWRLLAQTNSLAAGLNPNPNAWSTVPGSTTVNTVNITLDPSQTTVFYRLTYP